MGQPTTRGYIDSGTPWWSRCPREAGAPQGGEGQSRDPKMDMARQKNLRGEVLTKEAGRPPLPQALRHLLHHHVDDQDLKDVLDHTAGGSIRSRSEIKEKWTKECCRVYPSNFKKDQIFLLV